MNAAEIIDFLNRHNLAANETGPGVSGWVVCADGLRMSIQAHRGGYCNPRDSRGPWNEFEVGFPSEKVDEIMQWQDGDGDPTQSVYSYVPADAIAQAIINHGGLATVSVLSDRIIEAKAEIARLKQELAARDGAEPVAWLSTGRLTGLPVLEPHGCPLSERDGPWTPLYAHPPKADDSAQNVTVNKPMLDDFFGE